MAVSILAGFRCTFWYLWRILVYIFGGLQHLWPWPRGAGSSSCSGPRSGSSASTSPDKERLAQFDVFLNHRGPDVKMTFVSHLDAALRRAGCDPFLDAKSLVKGHHALNSINDALTGVLVHVAIFSPGYAESKYCLNELSDMLASNKPLIPVFYKVEPGDLRWPENKKGPFAKAFSHHLKRGRKQDVVKWKGTLKKAADITGFRFADNDDEEKLVKKVVAAVLHTLPAPCPIAPARHPVGLKKTSMHVISMLHNMGDNVGVMGICGMGGIGKTTLAREVYNQEQSKFEYWCFLEDVKDVKGTNVMNLQMKMVTKLLGKDAAKMVGDYAGCLEMIQKRKVLLVLDDISELKQFYRLIPQLKQLAPGSRVIITSRESDILNSIMAHVPQGGCALYPMPELNPSESLELFIKFAFQTRNIDEVDPIFHNDVKKITEACGGIPLALEVIGGYLAGKRNQPKCWTKALSVLKSNPDIMTRLQISYNGLVSDDEKCMFVDIACFMLGHSKVKALEVWNSIPSVLPSWYSLDRLIDKCLVKVDAKGQIRMHDLLRDMGQKIVMDRARGKLERQSHIWDPSKAAKLLRKGHGSNEVSAISIVGMESSSMVCKAESYAKMKELRYLLLDNCLVNGDFSGWSEELRWLQWRFFPHEELPQSLKLQDLAVLDLSNSLHLTRLWTRNIKIKFPMTELRMLILRKCSNLEELPHTINRFRKLKYLDLRSCLSLKLLPDSLKDSTELEELDLSGCTLLQKLPPLYGLKKLKILQMSKMALEELPQDFCELSSLKVVDIDGCKSLVQLSESFGNLSNLEELRMRGCEQLQKLPSSFCRLTKLSIIVLAGTALKELPEDFCELSGLKVVDIDSCKSLVQLPESFGNLFNLEELRMRGCEQLQKLPSSFCRLTKLKKVVLAGTALEELPEDFYQLCSLKVVDFGGCKSLVQLPESFGNLSDLEELRMRGCKQLQKLPSSFCRLTKLKKVVLAWTALEELPEDFYELSGLKVVDIDGCKSLVQLPESFGNLSNLEELRMRGCEQLQKLPSSFCRLTKLKKVVLAGTALEELPEDFCELSGLKVVDIDGCKNLVQLPESFGNLSNLEELQMRGCEQLQKLPSSFCRLTKLREVVLAGTALEELPEDFCELSGLKVVDIEGCKSLVQLPESFGNLSNLEELRMRGCEQLQKLPSSFCRLTKLKKVVLAGTALEELPEDFCELSGLKVVDIDGCKNLVQLPESFGNLSNLEELQMRGCEQLQKLPSSFCRLTKLREVVLAGTALEELPEDFCELSGLKVVDIEGCKSLVQLPESFGNLSNLEELRMRGCEQLQKLPSSFCRLTKLKKVVLAGTALEVLPEDFYQLCSLKVLDFGGCKSLVQLPESFGNLSNLEELRMRGCKQLQKLPSSFCRLTKLKKVVLAWTALEELPEDFCQLSGLKVVDIDGCKSLVQLPELFGNLSNLEELRMRGCKQLQKLPSSFCRLTKLREVVLAGTALEELPEDFYQLSGLKVVDIDGCKSLVQLPESFGCLSNLEELWMRGCEQLQKLPSSFCMLTKLKKVVLAGTALEVFPEDFGQIVAWKKVNSDFVRV